MVTQLTDIHVVGGSSPALSSQSQSALKVSRMPDDRLEPTIAQLDWTALPLDRWPCC